MTAPSSLTETVHADLMRLLDGPPDKARLERALRHLAKWRARVIANTLLQLGGATIRSGPFEGMAYLANAAEGGIVPRLLGAYEATLHPVIEEIVERGYPRILDIGCAEGYYAVGLARRLPAAIVHAHDTSDAALALCADLAEANGVADRLHLGGEVTPALLAQIAGPGTLILCDIEGAEETLLDPAATPALQRADIVVEVHDCFRPGLSGRLAARFAPTHEIRRLDRDLASDTLPPWMERLSDLDRLLALWEWRAGPTPWLWMTARG